MNTARKINRPIFRRLCFLAFRALFPVPAPAVFPLSVPPAAAPLPTALRTGVPAAGQRSESVCPD